ncbi:MAG: hypothetical protein PHX80_04295 [Candidatus Nanoarchaeia archaeon]|nr:hypothetical protein [Candidatus Nanoarchaeia archaeon]
MLSLGSNLSAQGSIAASTTAWILNTDPFEILGTKYIWVDAEVWADAEVWKG